MSAFFVTATGTDIGKTFITAGLIRVLREAGGHAVALKPVISGFSMEGAGASDSGILLAAMGEAISEDTLNRISPWRFSEPLSPDMAAAREGRSVDFASLTGFCRDAVQSHTGTLFIEGVGGVMVPLDASHSVLDWMATLNLPLIVVAGGYLGTISHSLTALDVLHAHGLNIAALVVNEGDADPVSADETMASMRPFAHDVPMVRMPRSANWEQQRESFTNLARLLGLTG